MRNDKNKTELFKMIFKTAVEEIPEIETTIITTMGSSVVTNSNLETLTSNHVITKKQTRECRILYINKCALNVIDLQEMMFYMKISP